MDGASDPPELPPPCRIPRTSSQEQSFHNSRPLPSDPLALERRESAPFPQNSAKPRKPVPLPRSKLLAKSPSSADQLSIDSPDIVAASTPRMNDGIPSTDQTENDYLMPMINSQNMILSEPAYFPTSSSQSSVSSYASQTNSIPRLSPTKPRTSVARSVSDAAISRDSNLIKWVSVENGLNNTGSSSDVTREPDVFSLIPDVPPDYSPPPPPDDESSWDDLSPDTPPPLPPRPLKKESAVMEKIDQPPLPLPAGGRNAVRHESEVRNGIATLCADYLNVKHNQKDQGKRWCVLKDGKISIFADKKSPLPKNTILCAEVLGIRMLAEKRNKLLFGFEVCHVRERSKSWTLICDSKEDANRWASATAKGVCDSCGMYASTPLVGCGEYEHAGKVFIRRGSSGDWIKCWVELIGRTVRVFAEDQVEEYDLRKAVSFGVVNLEFYESKAAAVCGDAVEESTPFILNMPGKSLHLQADTKDQTQLWMKLMQKRARECGDAIEDQPLTVEDVPVIVDRCIQFVSAHGLKSKGIYRHNGGALKIASIIDMFAKDAHSCYLLRDNFTEHDVAGALKRFLRDLPEPLIKVELYQPLLHCVDYDIKIRLLKYRSLLDQLPRIPNYVTLKKLLGHLKTVSESASENLMSVSNIAVSFGATLLRGSLDPAELHIDEISGNNSETTAKVITVMVDFLTFYEILFDVREEDLAKERKILAALEDMNKQKEQPQRAGDLLMGIYWIDRKTDPINIRIRSRLTAGELCQSLLERENLVHDTSYSLHEVTFDEKLKQGFTQDCWNVFRHSKPYERNVPHGRPVHFSEEVIPIILRWTDWNSCNICEYSSNYLCVRKNTVYEKSRALDRVPLSITQPLQFSKEKKFKRVSVDFTKLTISVHKSATVDKELGSWRVEDIVWFLGCSPQRTAPTQWNFSFIEKDKQTVLSKLKENRAAFGYTICCDDEASLDKWITAMLQAQALIDLDQQKVKAWFRS